MISQDGKGVMKTAQKMSLWEGDRLSVRHIPLVVPSVAQLMWHLLRSKAGAITGTLASPIRQQSCDLRSDLRAGPSAYQGNLSFLTSPLWLPADLREWSQPPSAYAPELEKRDSSLSLLLMGLGQTHRAHFLSPAKFPGCSSAVTLPNPERLLAPSATGNGPDNCSSRVGDFSVCICTRSHPRSISQAPVGFQLCFTKHVLQASSLQHYRNFSIERRGRQCRAGHSP